MEEGEPMVSVIITTYCRTSFLKLTIESVLNQSYKNIEVIVIDDGSPGEENKNLCNTYNDKVNYYKIENSGGPAKPRNYGYSKSKGKYIAFLDDDDLWIKEKLSIQVSILEKNVDYGLIHSYCKVINGDGIDQDRYIGKPSNILDKHGDVKMKMTGNWTLMMPTPLVRKSIIDKVGGFNEEIPPAGEDVEFWIRCSFITKFYYYDDYLAYYRIHEENISSNINNYFNLPLYLKKVLDVKLKQKIIDKEEYKHLVNNLTQMQIKNVKVNYFKTTVNLFILDHLWFLKQRNIKTLIKKTIY